MKKNYKLWYYIVSAALIVCLVFSFSFYNKITQLESSLENNYQNAFAAFINDTENLALLCGKAGVFGSSARGMSLMTEISALSAEAESQLAALPFEHRYIEEMSNYYNQLGDYALYCYDSLAAGERLDNLQTRQLAAFAQDMESVALRLQELQGVAYADGLRFTRMKDMGRYLDIENSASRPYDIAYVFTGLNQYFARKEDLDYYGKYSAHLQDMKALGLSGETLEAERAAAAAADFLRNIGKPYTAEQLVLYGESGEGSSMPAFHFRAEGDTEDISISVSKTGGKVLNYYNERPVIEQTVSVAAAKSMALEALAKCGYETMEASKQYKNGNTVCFEFAFRDGDEVLYYPDRINVEIALDNGELLALEAHEYYMYHTPRRLEEPQVLKEVAEAGLNGALSVEKSSMSLISDGKGREILCYEFRVKDEEGNAYVMHISTEDGSEQQLLKYYEDEEGFYTK